ncbi:MAG: oxidoreductase [Deltaproteobacteria bacterium]|jgi:NAD(P)-dependent dehydrogenase (short-subunit alcohol dehydrogenase family)|nr:oxidoreductase [Deltaproteobacteria bacterium]
MSQPFRAASVPDQSGRTVVVTGANTGIGWEAASVLAGKGARVLLACRSPEKGNAALGRIQELHPDADLAFVPLDLGSLESVRKGAARIDGEERLDLLINNAGIMMPPREETAEGFESQFGVNHLGHFALTGLLLGKLRETAGARVVTVSSGAHKAGRIQFDDIHAKKRYGRVERYGMSKLANLLFTHELQRRLEAARHGTAALACHPGVSETELSRNFPSWMKLLTPLFKPFSHPPPEGALPTLRAATDPEARGGEYYGPGGLAELSGPPVLNQPSRASRDPEVARRLWDLSIELTGVDPGI